MTDSTWFSDYMPDSLHLLKMMRTDVCSDSHAIRFWLHENEKLIESEIWKKDCFLLLRAVCIFDIMVGRQTCLTLLHRASFTWIHLVKKVSSLEMVLHSLEIKQDVTTIITDISVNTWSCILNMQFIILHKVIIFCVGVFRLVDC